MPSGAFAITSILAPSILPADAPSAAASPPRIARPASLSTESLSRLLATRSIGAAKPSPARILPRQSVGALTDNAVLPCHGLRSQSPEGGIGGSLTGLADRDGRWAGGLSLRVRSLR
jgi:hypothetical protein